MAARVWKRALDLVGSSFGLILASPLLLFCCLAILTSMGRPVFFRQQRPGLRGQPFTFYKFRTMTEGRDLNGHLLPDEKRITRLGALLRRTTLDELPSLWNVLRGDISLVGPRPLLMRYLERYSFEQSRRHETKPGLTGWAVVNGRNRLSWDDKFKLDVWYVDNQSLWLDLKIIIMTIGLVIRRKDVNAKGHATMPEFGIRDIGRGLRVLVLSAGRRVALVRLFKEAVGERGHVFVTDFDRLSPAAHFADARFDIGPFSGPQYGPKLLELVAREKIDLVVPTIDPDLPLLAELRSQLEALGCKALISSPEVIRIGNDKWETFKLFRQSGVPTIPSWLPGESGLPPKLFVKPRNGSASKDCYPATVDELPNLLSVVPNPIIQKRMEGAEITVDAFISSHGEIAHFVPRLRLKTLGGESIQGRTISDESVNVVVRQGLAALAIIGARGPITLQAFLEPEGPLLSEVNARFGGGYPLTQAAGGKYVDWVVEETLGFKPKIDPAYVVGLEMSRYLEELFIGP